MGGSGRRARRWARCTTSCTCAARGAGVGGRSSSLSPGSAISPDLTTTCRRGARTCWSTSRTGTSWPAPGIRRGSNS
eukprot:5027586-Alexandrium_andersonii.AAC.1